MGKSVNRQITTPVFRVSFPHLFKAHKAPNSDADPKFSIDMLYSSKAEISKFQKAFDEIMTEKFGSDKKKWPKVKYPLIKDGNEKDGITGYENMFYVTARSDRRPTVVDINKEEILDERQIYAGCFARAQVSLFFYDSNGNKGVSCGLNAVQFVKDGEPFGAGKVDVNKAFADDIPDDGADDPSNYSDADSDVAEQDAGF